MNEHTYTYKEILEFIKKADLVLGDIYTLDADDPLRIALYDMEQALAYIHSKQLQDIYRLMLSGNSVNRIANLTGSYERAVYRKVKTLVELLVYYMNHQNK